MRFSFAALVGKRCSRSSGSTCCYACGPPNGQAQLGVGCVGALLCQVLAELDEGAVSLQQRERCPGSRIRHVNAAGVFGSSDFDHGLQFRV